MAPGPRPNHQREEENWLDIPVPTTLAALVQAALGRAAPVDAGVSTPPMVAKTRPSSRRGVRYAGLELVSWPKATSPADARKARWLSKCEWLEPTKRLRKTALRAANDPRLPKLPLNLQCSFRFQYLLGSGPNRPIGSLAPVSGSILAPRRSTFRRGLRPAHQNVPVNCLKAQESLPCHRMVRLATLTTLLYFFPDGKPIGR